jgi:tRNA U34 5-methylaminomethyl-2-thiouridine-forming methyltransferase MnmC
VITARAVRVTDVASSISNRQRLTQSMRLYGSKRPSVWHRRLCMRSSIPATSVAARSRIRSSAQDIRLPHSGPT